MHNRQMTPTSSHILASPLLLAPQYTGLVADSERTPTQADLECHHLDVMAMYGVTSVVAASQDRPYAVSDGVAFIPVRGSLLNRFNYSCSWATGYRSIVRMVEMAAADPGVVRVIYDVDSYGGEAAGCFESAEECRKILRAAKKPSLAMIDSNAYSAGYAFACCADQISIIPSGGAGSIGVIMVPVEYSGYFKKAGVEYTPIYSGDHKADGNIYQPLPEAVKAQFKARVDTLRQRFAEYVSGMRGIAVDDVLATEAQSFSAQDALANGLVDKISSTRQSYEEFLNYELEIPETAPLIEETEVQPMADANIPVTPTATVDAAQAERARISAVLALPGAGANAKLAQTLALTPGMTAETAATILDAAAPAPSAPAATVAPVAPAATTNPLDTAMSQVATHQIRPDSVVEPKAEGNSDAESLDFILSTIKAHGAKIKTA